MFNVRALRFSAWSGLLLSALLIISCSVKPPPAQGVLDEKIWIQYRQAFISDDGRVIDHGNQGITHTEGQGYGMILAVAANDRHTFDALWAWTQKNLQREGDALFSYRWDPGAPPPIQDANNASDGEILIAWALLRASERWHVEGYKKDALHLIDTIDQMLVRPSPIGDILLPGVFGFERSNYTLINPSYWIFPAFQAFERSTASATWRNLRESGLKLLEHARFGKARLTPDWVRLHDDGRMTLDSVLSSRFGFDAVRIPLYSCWGGVEDQSLLEAISAQWSQSSNPAWIDLRTEQGAPYPLTPSQRAMQQFVQRCLNPNAGSLRQPLGSVIPQDYYASTLALLGGIALQERFPELAHAGITQAKH
ncbi:MAG: glycosyl hydrolase family 8 [Pseudomonadota bacterium]